MPPCCAKVTNAWWFFCKPHINTRNTFPLLYICIFVVSCVGYAYCLCSSNQFVVLCMCSVVCYVCTQYSFQYFITVPCILSFSTVFRGLFICINCIFSFIKLFHVELKAYDTVCGMQCAYMNNLLLVYVFLSLSMCCLCILRRGYPDWGFSGLFPQL